MFQFIQKSVYFLTNQRHHLNSSTKVCQLCIYYTCNKPDISQLWIPSKACTKQKAHYLNLTKIQELGVCTYRRSVPVYGHPWIQQVCSSMWESVNTAGVLYFYCVEVCGYSRCVPVCRSLCSGVWKSVDTAGVFQCVGVCVLVCGSLWIQQVCSSVRSLCSGVWESVDTAGVFQCVGVCVLVCGSLWIQQMCSNV